MAKRRELPADFLWVDIVEAKRNKLFTEEQRQSVRFLRYNRSIRCAECGKRRRVMWTMLCTFLASSPAGFTMARGTKRHLPLTPVCGAHPIGPALEEASPVVTKSYVVIKGRERAKP